MADVTFQCTAHTRVQMQQGKEDMRCERPIGHAGLHRLTNLTSPKGRSANDVQEFSDSQAWYPHMTVPSNKRMIP